MRTAQTLPLAPTSPQPSIRKAETQPKEWRMNTLPKATVACLAALTIAAGMASSASAMTYTKKRLRAPYAGAVHSRQVTANRDQDDSIGGYYEHRLNAVRFGSQRWWHIYDEMRGGSDRR
jgi:hypothetical protein